MKPKLEVVRDRDMPPTVAGRVPPHDLDAEGVVLEHLLLREEKRADLCALLRQQHFYSDDNGWIFQAVRSLVEDGKEVDLVAVAGWLRDRDKFHKVGGVEYLCVLVHEQPYSFHVEQHADRIIGKWKQRKLIATAQHVAAEAYGDVGDVSTYLTETVDRFEAIQETHGMREPRTVGAVAQAVFDAIAAGAETGATGGLSTGLVSLDRRLGRLEPGGVTVIGARPSMGKTALARKLLTGVPAQGTAGAMFSMETKEKKLATQWAFTIAGVDKDKVRSRDGLSTQDWASITGAIEQLQRAPVWIDDTPHLTLSQVRGKARRFKTEALRRGLKLGLIVIDYLQLMNGAEGVVRGANREQEVATLSRGIKVLAGELDVHVVLLSQINRGVESRSVQNKRPTISDLRESGAIEADADNVLLLYRDEYYHPDTRDKGIAEIIIAKQRDGKRGVTVRTSFTDWCTRFEDLTYDDRDPRCPD